MAKKKAVKTVKRKKSYGMFPIQLGEKVTLISVQNKNGWSLGVATDKKTRWVRNTRFATKALVQSVAGKKVVFFPLKAAK